MCTSELVSKGDVVLVSGSTVEEVFTSVCSQVKLPSGITPENLVKELMYRESVLSTAVGNGIAIPHPRRPIVAKDDESCVIVAYLETPIEMRSPDSKKIFVMFIILSASTQIHGRTLSSLAAIFRREEFKKVIQTKPGKDQLIKLLQRCEPNR